ncbi:Methylated-DNA--protein-cysteine methyltransferase, constitutive [Fundidesulfovibrio magnetotacticus]|uniref:Methylated-DNA--protein-cysteine methyltransferase n=1 Tax=Fundidesulfovibrio magnetotacticus TaxID=2730080 RepID=A0A6V8M054_9BACT|nr:methylated-DNA--[protein]-cysteine S-methyltransferase [Fundidesulfovibrio magnetotacticus]GFK95237.1 Methylated-DNA--protein-cysteine methyltransferase, constitutive [Fundidesulfovibrio magnetotacticus]
MNLLHVDTPVGRLGLAAQEDALAMVLLPGEAAPQGCHPAPTPLLREAARQLQAYFKRGLRLFDLPLAPAGTPFQLAVWEAVRGVPYGCTASYAHIAARAGRPGSARAAGAANGRNPLPLVTPCHRVVGSDGSLTGYRGGLALKRFLLDLEQGRASPGMPHG